MKIKNDNQIPEIERLYRLKKQDGRQFAQCFGRAFSQYPFYRPRGWSEHNGKTLTVFWTMIFRIGFKSGVIIAPDKKMDGIALFFAPGFKGAGIFEYLWAGGLWLPFEVSLSTVRKLLAFDKHVFKIRKKHTGFQCWYLYFLAVEPEQQGKGIASSLLGPMLTYFDRTGQDCYVETQEDKNVPFYEHYGFEVVEISTISELGKKNIAMLRKAKNNRS